MYSTVQYGTSFSFLPKADFNPAFAYALVDTPLYLPLLSLLAPVEHPNLPVSPTVRISIPDEQEILNPAPALLVFGTRGVAKHAIHLLERLAIRLAHKQECPHP